MVKIKSISDVITNSSDETYIIKNSGSAGKVSDLFDEYMEKYHHDEWNDTKCSNIKPEMIEDLDDGTVLIDWPILCNLDDAYGYLNTCFGKDNVIDAKYGKYPALDRFYTKYDEEHQVDLSWLDELLNKNKK